MSIAALHVHRVPDARVELARKVVGHVAIRAAWMLQDGAHDLECLRSARGSVGLRDGERGDGGAQGGAERGGDFRHGYAAALRSRPNRSPVMASECMAQSQRPSLRIQVDASAASSFSGLPSTVSDSLIV